ncbi:MAG TPA: hypothetical protein VFT22_12395 [Kofleriaceae bacterium]|nr:hypothetical protein [Kofleriaceae bacterium]
MNKLAVIVLLVGLSACSKKKPEEGREPAQTATPAPVVGSATATPSPAPSPAAGTGSAPAAPATGTTGTTGTTGAAPTAQPDAACATATTLTCDPGQRDGCTDGLTTVHVCVPGDAKAGPPCAQPAPACPAGQIDACAHEPPRSNNHVCVVVPRPTP